MRASLVCLLSRQTASSKKAPIMKSIVCVSTSVGTKMPPTIAAAPVMLPRKRRSCEAWRDGSTMRSKDSAMRPPSSGSAGTRLIMPSNALMRPNCAMSVRPGRCRLSLAHSAPQAAAETRLNNGPAEAMASSSHRFPMRFSMRATKPKGWSSMRLIRYPIARATKA